MIPEREGLDSILMAIKDRSNYDLSNYSINSLSRRFVKIQSDLEMTEQEIVEKIYADSSFVEILIKKITVHTTELFRDPKIWANLRENIIPLYKSKSEINIWHPGCSTGQEVYSMMILLDWLKLLDRAQIFASDINEDVIETSKRGEYKFRFNKDFHSNFIKSFEIGDNIKDDNYNKYLKLDKLQDKIRMSDFLIQKPVYRKIDLVKHDNLFEKKFDIIMCRNVIIYFNSDLQNQILKMFHRIMTDNSCLILGIHESIIGSVSSKFEKKDGVYFKC
ncbi:MAG: hypothetical protein K9H49_18220 [Bacteroidales bacterium]|nr:hypothetical protein [Bacteroidales bacterium]MCF8391476.1 hypothetical protein [Bacteroidales bacterium]